MKRFFTLIIALVTLAACGPEENTASFDAEDIIGTKWEGELKFYESGRLKSNSAATIRFDSASAGQFTQKRNGASGKENFDFSYSVKGERITFDCPVINGTWSISNYSASTMVLSLEPSKNGVMTLYLK